MDYVISPWFFYIINIVDNINNVIGTLGIISIVLSLSCVVAIFLFWCDDDEKSLKFISKRLFKPAVTCFIILSIIDLFIPTKETMYQMTAAKFVTYQNIEMAGETAKEAFDYIVDSIKEITEEAESTKQSE